MRLSGQPVGKSGGLDDAGPVPILDSPRRRDLARMTPHTARVVSAAGERMATVTLTEFLLARIAEDEAAARAVPPLGHNFDMGGNRQDERWIFDRTLPSSSDGMGNWSEHRHSPTTAEHFSRHDPARVLAECEAKRRIVKLWNAEAYTNEDGDVLGGQGPETHHDVLCALAAVYADHPDYREEWRP